MKTHNQRFLLTCLLGLVLVGLTGERSLSQQTSVTASSSSSASAAAPLKRKEIAISPEERVIRATYEKLTMLSKAGLLINGEGGDENPPAELFLKFDLRNFRVGPIGEILEALDSEIKTGPSGEIINVTRAVSQHNKGREYVGYMARWTNAQYSSGYDHQWKISDIFNLESPRYYDVGVYALYDVTVSFKGKSRAYRALALFHNPYGSVENLKPTFWDSIVGTNASLTDVWQETLPAIDLKNSPFLKKDSPAVAAPPNVSSPQMSHARRLPARWFPQSGANPKPALFAGGAFPRVMLPRTLKAGALKTQSKTEPNTTPERTARELVFKAHVLTNRITSKSVG